MHRLRLKIVAGLALWSLAGCWDSATSSHEFLDSDPWCRQISTAGKTIAMGENGFAVALSQDVCIGTTEVSQSQFGEVMGYLPSDLPQENGELPVTNVNWFEAALFCNELSKREGLDTVYEWESLAKDHKGAALIGNGVWARLERDGYRLPTEAEWVAAARGKGNLTKLSRWPWGEKMGDLKSYAWIADDAKSSVQPVASKKANSWGIYDMLGNALEWTNDWLGHFPDTNLTDWAGSSEPSLWQEKVAKGGSLYDYAPDLLRRTDAYPLANSTRLPWLGFRVARGVYQVSNYGTGTGPSAEAPIRLASSDKVRNFFGHLRVRLSWQAQSGIKWIDFGQFVPQVTLLSTSNKGTHPSFSPNGRWLAHGTRQEGQRGPSKGYVVDFRAPYLSSSLGEGSISVPRWWKGLDSSVSLHLLWNDSTGPNQDSLEWSKGKTLGKVFNGYLSIDTNFGFDVAGSWNGGASESGDWLASGYTRLLVYDRQQGLTLAPEWGQVCNVSVAPKGPARWTFLDFGHPSGRGGVSSAYGIHEYLFMMDSTLQIVQRWKVPLPFLGWDHVEWSADGRYLVGTVWDESQERRSIVALEPNSGSHIVLAEGPEFANPALWIDEERGLPDSLGMYSVPLTEWREQYRSVVTMLWERRDRLQVIALGSSRTQAGIQAAPIYPLEFLNMAYSGADLYASYFLLRDYLSFGLPKLKTVILGLDIDFFARDSSRFGWRIKDSPGYREDQRNGFFRSADVQDVKEQLLATTSPFGIVNYFSQGSSYGPVKGWDSLVSQGLEQEWTTGNHDWRQSIELLRQIIALADSLGIHVLGVVTPQHPGYATATYPFRYGPPDKVTAQEIMDSIQQVFSQTENHAWIDLHQWGKHEYTDLNGADQDHLSYRGGMRVTARLVKEFPEFFTP